MEPVGIEPEFLLQFYDDLFLILGWLLGGGAVLIAVVFLLGLWFECFAPYRSRKSRSSKEVSPETSGWLAAGELPAGAESRAGGQVGFWGRGGSQA